MTTKDTTLGNAQPAEAVLQKVLGSGAPSQPALETPAGVPANPQHHSVGQREQTVTGGPGSASACCGPAVQQSCCEPAAKADCCGAPTAPGSCGCK